MLVGWGLVSDESPKQGQSSVMFWLFNEFQWVAMDQIALIFQWMDVTWCNQYLHKTLRGIAINWKFGNPLFKNYIYIYIYIYTSIYQIRKKYVWAPSISKQPSCVVANRSNGVDLLTLHPNLQTFQWRDDAGLATADGNYISGDFFGEDL
jgi:hypothetical protein